MHISQSSLQTLPTTHASQPKGNPLPSHWNTCFLWTFFVTILYQSGGVAAPPPTGAVPDRIMDIVQSTWPNHHEDNHLATSVGDDELDLTLGSTGNVSFTL